jgi:16S rRNA (cytosine967-C5)-methyltransferase
MPKKEQRKRFSRPASSSPRRPQRQSERRVREQDPNTIPSYLVNHLAQALRMVLKLDGPADVLLSVYFKRNHELGSRDRGFVAEAVYAALRHLAGIRWRMAPAVPERSPRLAALVTLASLYGMEALDSRDVGNDRKALEAILDKKDSDADPATRAELPGWLYERVRSQYPDHDLFFKEIATGAPLDIREPPEGEA